MFKSHHSVSIYPVFIMFKSHPFVSCIVLCLNHISLSLCIKTLYEVVSQIEQSQITIRNDGACCTTKMAQQADDLTPDDTASRWWCCHSGFGKLLYKLCRNLQPPAMWAQIAFFCRPAMRTRWIASAAPHKGG